MEIKTTNADGVSIIEIPEHLDINSSSFLKDTLTQTIESADNIELDFAKTALVSSAGLRVLLQAQKTVQVSGKKLVYKNVSPDVMEVFEMTGVTKIFSII